ncbi:hypothetical protein Verru16b_00080 [Lacunisphaera limnophila]|uniref:YtkA-like domain-containing protein n=1 Tax=Lacunisphaera limnophila TaxID=1838286 RepID=A0A1I7PHG2_9BACT|nr:hypothetical protein [Lacunisphaera limnophila]AOS43042.1 hypothetical protein Verru16b_00080 [Lacunisphaera limnophila]
MNKLDELSEAGAPPPRQSAAPRGAGLGARGQVLVITSVALALYVGIRLLPGGSNVNHMDFRVEGKGAIEFCDPANPQFIPVVSVLSPVVMGLKAAGAPARNEPVEFTVTLRTASGKPIGPADLIIAHTRKLHLLVVDPTLSDYQHVHPEPGRRDGEWVFTLTPRRSGVYRVFADFTPAATQRGLYAAADFTVPGAVPTVINTGNTTWLDRGFRFELGLPPVLHAGQPTDLTFRISSPGTVKEPVPLQPVMGAFAHLVAFDEARSGFAHLHPMETDLTKSPDALNPELNFKITIPQPGRYVIWAQVDLGGTEVFAPFWVDVLP